MPAVISARQVDVQSSSRTRPLAACPRNSGHRPRCIHAAPVAQEQGTPISMISFVTPSANLDTNMNALRDPLEGRLLGALPT